MGILTNEILTITKAGIVTDFDDALMSAMQGPMAKWQAVASQIDTTLPSQQYAHLGQGGVMVEFIERLERQTLNEYDFTVLDKTYNAPIAIPRRWLEDDQYGLIQQRIAGLANAPVRHWNKIAFVGLALGFTSLCYDGQFFFDTDHNESGTNQSNRTTSALSDASLEAALVAMRGFTDDKGEPLELEPNVLVVGPKLERLAYDLIGSDVVVIRVGDGAIGSGATAGTNYNNFHRGRYTLVVSSHLRGTYDDYWFLLDTTREVKPIIIQNRVDVPITVESDMDEDSAKMKEEYTVRVRGRYAQTYGPWQFAYGGIVA